MRRLAFPMAAALATPATLLAHPGLPLEPHDLWTADAWRFDPLVVVGLALCAGLYLRGARSERGVRRWEVASFWAGWLALFVALASPLHPVGEVLFSAHMVQHELIMVAAAPLLVLGHPLIPFLWGLPARLRRPVGRCARAPWIQSIWSFLAQPINAFVLHFAVLWAWHIPFLFQATIASDLAHSAQHISFLASALAFWWALLRARGAGRQYGEAVLLLFGTMLHTGLLGALLTFSTTTWYPAYAETTEAWNLTPLEDQQLAGLIMWVPPGIVYTGIALVLFALWIRQFESPAGPALAPADRDSQ